jgi:hypothetical protein
LLFKNGSGITMTGFPWKFIRDYPVMAPPMVCEGLLPGSRQNQADGGDTSTTVTNLNRRNKVLYEMDR